MFPRYIHSYAGTLETFRMKVRKELQSSWKGNKSFYRKKSTSPHVPLLVFIPQLASSKQFKYSLRYISSYEETFESSGNSPEYKRTQTAGTSQQHSSHRNTGKAFFVNWLFSFMQSLDGNMYLGFEVPTHLLIRFLFHTHHTPFSSAVQISLERKDRKALLHLLISRFPFHTYKRLPCLKKLRKEYVHWRSKMVTSEKWRWTVESYY